MDPLITIISIILVNIAAWLTPGPNMFAVMNASLTAGRRNGVLTGLGLSLAAVLWTGLAVIGISSLFEIYPALMLWSRILGAVYLVWLGITSFRAALSPRGDDMVLSYWGPDQGKAFVTGFLVSATNPKAAFFFGSILTAFVPSDASSSFLAGIVVLCGLLSVLCHSITAMVFSSKGIVRWFGQSRRLLAMGFGATFSALGVGVAIDTVRRL